MAKHLEKGRHAERLALQYLTQRGLKPVAANYFCRLGELDLVMLDRKTLVVVEIRYRENPGLIGPLESVSPAKQRKVILTSQHFVQRHRAHRSRAIRFDVVAISGPLADYDLHWVPGAFTPDDILGFEQD